ncbi:MAG: hypothetical protein IJ195_05500 [Lachnospiraceae bacterium]|nr:hypothetical protein [Lachnospiraceae bacterium]
MAGLSLFTDILHMEKVSVWKRVLSYFLFIIGFVLNSTLFFYVIVFIMIVMNIIHYRKVKRLVAFLDYLILPIAFYSVKTLFFTPYGEYEGYNEVSLNNLIKALTLIPRADWNVLHSTYINIKNTGIMVYAIGMSIILIGIIHHKNLFTVIRQKSKDNNILSKVTVYTNRFESFKTLVLGIIILSCGLFPYIVVRQKNMINTTGWVGRDSILVAWGVAMTVYAICSIVFRKPFSEVILIYLLICSCAFFGKYYLSYQQDYYRQIGFQYQLSLHEDELENMKNIVYMNSDKSLINCQHFYQLNGNAEEVFGDQTRFFIPGLDGLKYLSKEAQDSLNRFVTSGNYHMNDYDVNYKKIDAVIDYSCSISLA